VTVNRVVVLAVLFVGPLTAAPVPKAVKAKVPQVAGTVWVGERSDEDLTGCVYTFAADGAFTYHHPKWGQTHDKGFWELEGATLTCRVGPSGAATTVTFAYTGGALVGSVNCLGETWEETLRPKEK
jgi:hypothetical protein